jgi:cytochrome c oxidase cbb3-type subunit IV
MSYETMRHFADSWGLIFLFLVFLVAVGWALRPGASFRDQAGIPFRHDDHEDQTHG